VTGIDNEDPAQGFRKTDRPRFRISSIRNISMPPLLFYGMNKRRGAASGGAKFLRAALCRKIANLCLTRFETIDVWSRSDHS
jgi:hypothetical protein